METQPRFDFEKPKLELSAERDEDCPVCNQPLGSNVDCDRCNSAAKRTPREIKQLREEKANQARKFGLRPGSKRKK